MFHVKKKQMTSEQKLAELIEGIWGIGAESPQSTAPPPRGIISLLLCQEQSGQNCALLQQQLCQSVRRLANPFSLLGVNPLPLHAQLHQKQFLKNLDRFSASQDELLMATDVAARGLDIPNIEHVIHYQVPRTSESYIHRSGRTARATRRGLSLLLIDPGEQTTVKKLCTTLARAGLDSLPVFPVDVEKMGRVREMLNIARKLGRELRGEWRH